MFDTLAEKLQAAFAKLRGNAKLTEADVDVALREVRLALLEADVNFRVVKEFVKRVKERAIGEQILDGLNPAQQVVKIVRDELIVLLAGEDAEQEEALKGSAAVGLTESAAAKLNFAAKGPTVIMLCGLQGAGKTTLAGKLANYLRKQGKTPVLAACDVQRPAAIKQLQVVGEQVKTSVFTLPGENPIKIASEAVEWAKSNRADVVILDTAGRLHVDEALMDELRGVRDSTQPHEILLVLDAMTGQDAVNVALEFNEAIGVGGFVLTKIDGDTRGGAAISVRAVVGKPIKFVGVGEKMDALEVFYPDRMASRILGMGDVLSLIQKAEQAVDEKQAAEMEKKLRKGKFDFEDFLGQMQQLRKLGPLEKLLELLPGVGPAMKEFDFAAGEKEMARFEAIVRSMTVKERRNPDLLNGSRRKRIAIGAGVTVHEVNEAIKRFDMAKSMMQALASGKMPGMPGAGGMGPMGRMPAGMAGMARHGMGRAQAKKKKSGGNGGGGGADRFRNPFSR